MTSHLEPEAVAPRGSTPGSRQVATGVAGVARVAMAVLAALAALALLPLTAAAQGSDTPSLSFDAFGTLGAVYSTEDRADFVWNPFRPDGPGHSYDISPEVDSRLGGQLSAHLTPGLTAVAQVVVEQTQDEDYDPSVEWGYVQYAFSPEFSVRAGRMPLPAFMVSEFRKVSYANPWVRPPVELYSIIPVFSLDGAEARYRLQTGEWTSVIQATFGRNETDFANFDGSIESDNALHLNYTLRRGGLRARVGFARSELTIEEFEPLFDAFREFGPVGDAVADRYELDETPFEFATLGVEYDPGGWFAMGEVGVTDSNSILASSAAGYVSAGYRIGPVTPYAVYSRIERIGGATVPGLPAAAFPPGPRETAEQLNAVLDAIRGAALVQQNLAVGGRWDVATGVALKAQVDLIDVLGDSPGTFINAQPGFDRGGSAQLVSVATTFVF